MIIPLKWNKKNQLLVGADGMIMRRYCDEKILQMIFDWSDLL